MTSPRSGHGLGALLVAGGIALVGSLAPSDSAPGQETTTVTFATITGYVLDAATGRPVANASVSTMPPTDTVVTNGQGLYALNAGYAFGTATIVAEASRYRQVRATCVRVKAGLNTLGDVTLLHEDEDVDDDCPSACGSGQACRLGQCVPSCNPACACTEKCEDGACVPNLAIPAEDSCGENATWLGGGLCECKRGAVPSADGRACVTGNETTSCPENAFATEVGCQCSQGFVPNRDGDRCVTPEEAAVPAPLGNGTIVNQWTLPFAMPRALAVSDNAVWTLDLEANDLVTLDLSVPGNATVSTRIPLGPDAWRTWDMAATEDTVYLARRGLGSYVAVAPGARYPSTIVVVDVASGTISHLAPNGYSDMLGIALDGDEFVVLEMLSIHRRSVANAQQVGIVQTVESFYPVGDAGRALFLLQAPGGAGTAPSFGLAFTRNQLLTFVGVTYDGSTFLANFDLLNASNARGLRGLNIAIPGSHVAGFDVAGSRSFVVVGGAGLDAPIIGEVTFGDLL